MRLRSGSSWSSNAVDHLPQINQRCLVSKRNLQSDAVRLLNDSLDLRLDNSASVHVDLDAVADLKFAQVVVADFMFGMVAQCNTSCWESLQK